ncbi:hypothetical protein HJC23_012184 [Cyclotella cryptica]|uniref:Cytosine-specific methyltransferase n=1 Tax=Cyclotella cryptica TaxID=29204 RepID=A0ABD3PVC1_9STRA
MASTIPARNLDDVRTCDSNDRSTKRFKQTDGEGAATLCVEDLMSPSFRNANTNTAFVVCSKGRVSVDANESPNMPPSEYVIHLPPQLTKSAYQTLLSTDCAARPWHLEGRFGSRTHVVERGIMNGIPILFDRASMEEKASSSNDLRGLLNTQGVEIVEKEFSMHKPLTKCEDGAIFTYAELFGGIGGFGVALDALGGKCLFYSEIDERCRETYALNFDTPSHFIHGDIYQVPDSAFPEDLDLLVAGFPCQPFSKLGDQPGFDCHKGRGRLFLEIVRVLSVSHPRSFLLENVPGLLYMKDTLTVILNSLRGAGYKVKVEVCSARGLVATKRNRLFFVGIRDDLVESRKDYNSSPTTSPSFSDEDANFFQFPYIPDLNLCCHDILDYESLPRSELDILRLSSSAFEQLNKNKRWRPHQLAWPNVHCDPLTSHYGNAVGRGDSQLVPSCSPYPPRRFSVRECARIMGFPNTFTFCSIRVDAKQGEMAHRKEAYRMLGNAVCPPLIAALAGSVLDAARVALPMPQSQDCRDLCHDYWIERGRRTAVALAHAALRPTPAPLPAGCIVWAEKKALPTNRS